MKKSRYTKESGSAFKPTILGALVIWISFLAFSLICTFILFSGSDPTPRASLFSLISFMAAGGVGSIVNKQLFRSSRSNAPLFSSLLCALIYVFISSVSIGKISIGSLATALCFTVISALATMSRKKKPRHRQKLHR